VLVLLRLSIVVALLLAFFEPTLHLTRFATEPPTFAVLFDASRSMQLFGADSLRDALLGAIERSVSSSPSSRYRVSYFCFGDSLRACPSPGSLTFEDRRSVFPAALEHDAARRAQTVLIVSDGNWSNPYYPRGGLERKSCFYVRMPGIVNRPYVRMTARTVPAEVPVDSTSRVIVQLDGFKTSRDAVQVVCSRGGRELAPRLIESDSGFFADTVVLTLPSSRVGTYLYRVRAGIEADSLYSTCYVVQQVVRRSFVAMLHADRPSLDNRFLKLALLKENRWSLMKAASAAKRPDVAFFFQWNEDSRSKLRLLPANATAVLVGCMPCDKAESTEPRRFEPILSSEYAGDTTARFVHQIPPPARLYRCANVPSRRAETILAARTTAEQGSAPDSIPTLFTDVIEGRRALVLAAQGLWRWDFWPLSFGNIEHPASFSAFFLSRVSELARANANRSFYVFPERTPAYETDSLAFSVVLPAHLQSKTLDQLRLRVVAGTGDTLVDTSFHDAFFGSRATRLTVPPLPAGAYRYECKTRSGGVAVSYDDSLHVHEGNAELLVDEQNTIVLGRIAAPLALDDTTDLLAYLEGEKVHQAATSTRRQAVRIRQTWQLLAAVLLFLATEWFLRKRWRID
jgi:hypothetical protein